MHMVMPKLWNSGSAVSTVSFSTCRLGIHDRTWTALATRLRWVSWAPLDTPVVPPVYISTAVSSGVTSTGCGLAGALARRSWNQ